MPTRDEAIIKDSPLSLRSVPASRTICWNRGVEPSSTSRSGGTSPRCCGATAPRWPWNSGPSTSQSLIGAHTWRGPSPKTLALLESLPGGAFLCRPTACDANGAVLRARPCKMAVPLAALARLQASGRAGRVWPGGYSHAAGSLVLRRMDRRGTRGPCADQEVRHQERQRRPATMRFVTD